ncbi:MAG: ABC transporter substrate-binding protein [Methanomicrobiales archaeon]|jgi:iron complex transport system substrate-binding protein|nr:ABC transporter substrate-binding protein [Methanomicrobiales archaeon]
MKATPFTLSHITILLIALLAISPASAWEITPDGEYNIIIDMAGYESIVPADITSLGSLDPFGTQLVFVLDALDILTSVNFGPADYEMIRSLYPQFDDSFVTHYGKKVNVEELLTTYPDVTIGRYGSDESINTPVRSANIPVVVDYVESPELLIESANMLGAMLGKEADAAAFEEYFMGTIEKLKNQTDLVPEDERLFVYMTKSEPLNTFDAEQYQSSMIEIAGASSVSAGESGADITINLEQLYLWDPDVIMLAPYCSASIEDIMVDSQWSDLKAVKNGAVYRLPKYLASWDLPVPESILGMIWLAQTLYPEYVDLNIEEEIVTFYSTFYGLDIDAETVDFILTDTKQVNTGGVQEKQDKA